MREVKTGSNQYCGPAVLSILTGRSTDECASLIRSVDPHYSGREVQLTVLVEVLKKISFNCNLVPNTSGSIFSVFHRIYNNPGFYVVVVRKHVVCVEVQADKQILLCDNHTKEPINGAASARLGQFVEAIYKVEPKPAPVFLRNEIEVKVEYYGAEGVLEINKHSIYSDPEDNVHRMLTYFRATKEELLSIRDQLLIKV